HRQRQILREILGSREICCRCSWGACFSGAVTACPADLMSTEEPRRSPPSTEASPSEAEVDPQLSACAQEGPLPEGLAESHPPGQGAGAAGLSPDIARLAIGQLLGGRYRIERELGEGGMGVVYLAADEQVPGERFAIKVLKEVLRPEALT